MNNAHEHVLQMLQDGKISAEDAEKLLSALEATEQTPHDNAPLTGDILKTTPQSPDFKKISTILAYSLCC